MGVAREPFNYKRSSRTMDEPSNIWDTMQTDHERWSRHLKRKIHFAWTYVFVLLAIAVLFLGIAMLMKG